MNYIRILQAEVILYSTRDSEFNLNKYNAMAIRGQLLISAICALLLSWF